MNDTIAAVATSLGIGAISIIRVSGPLSIKIVNKIFKGSNLEKVKTHTINYGHILENNNIIDEVLVTIMRAPKTFTTEDVVEINCHGGIATTNKVLEILLNNGCRLAEPGEFTKRAYLNGRIDLLEAESIMDLINSKTEASRNLAINQLNGKVSSMIHDLRNEIVNILANIEVNIDYPEYEDAHEITIKDINIFIEQLETKVNKILKESNNGKIIKNGINVSIVGRPNVGKSSILNRLLDEDKAIVTDIPGTTRDVVEGQISLSGVMLNLSDTAGIRETDDIVENIGVEKSLKILEDSDLILFVLNNNKQITQEELDLYNKIKVKQHIIIINKIDLPTLLNLEGLNLNNIIKMSTINKKGLDELKQKIIEIFNLENIEQKDLTYLSNARSISIIKEVSNLINSIKESLKNNVPVDIIEIDIKRIWDLLGNIIGETYENELIDKLFSQFCLGK